MASSAVCALCPAPATVHCPADSANLCASCDLTVHSANTIVHRHVRTVLCRCCAAPTTVQICGLPASTAATPPCICASCMMPLLWPSTGFPGTNAGNLVTNSQTSGPCPQSLAAATGSLLPEGLTSGSERLLQGFLNASSTFSLGNTAAAPPLMTHLPRPAGFVTGVRGGLVQAATVTQLDDNSPISVLTTESDVFRSTDFVNQQPREKMPQEGLFHRVPSQDMFPGSFRPEGLIRLEEAESYRACEQQQQQEQREHSPLTLSLFPLSADERSSAGGMARRIHTDVTDDSRVSCCAVPPLIPVDEPQRKRQRVQAGSGVGASRAASAFVPFVSETCTQVKQFDGASTMDGTGLGKRPYDACEKQRFPSTAEATGAAAPGAEPARGKLGKTASARLRHVLLTWQSRLGLQVPTVRALAFHMLQRVLLRLQPTDMAAESLRVLLAACLWVAAKNEENQKCVPKAKAVAAVAKVPVSRLASYLPFLTCLDFSRNSQVNDTTATAVIPCKLTSHLPSLTCLDLSRNPQFNDAAASGVLPCKPVQGLRDTLSPPSGLELHCSHRLVPPVSVHFSTLSHPSSSFLSPSPVLSSGIPSLQHLDLSYTAVTTSFLDSLTYGARLKGWRNNAAEASRKVEARKAAKRLRQAPLVGGSHRHNGSCCPQPPTRLYLSHTSHPSASVLPSLLHRCPAKRPWWEAAPDTTAAADPSPHSTFTKRFRLNQEQQQQQQQHQHQQQQQQLLLPERQPQAESEQQEVGEEQLEWRECCLVYLRLQGTTVDKAGATHLLGLSATVPLGGMFCLDLRDTLVKGDVLSKLRCELGACLVSWGRVAEM
ncbi:unnamed protein product [Closterium sp. NIES-64]|nr:unnamed protein product [Closterium sp. NIES-64]